MIDIKDIINALSFIFTVFLVIYGFQKGYDLIELYVYNLYFISIISSQLINLFKKEEK